MSRRHDLLAPRHAMAMSPNPSTTDCASRAKRAEPGRRFPGIHFDRTLCEGSND
jgi:hypothetical protein